MVSFLVLSLLGAFSGAAVAQTFESPDFNVTEGLLDLGIDITELPELTEFVERSAISSCAPVVSSLIQTSCSSIVKSV
jgi:hypothetical protein